MFGTFKLFLPRIPHHAVPHAPKNDNLFGVGALSAWLFGETIGGAGMEYCEMVGADMAGGWNFGGGEFPLPGTI